jgi:hypothetical protein
VRSGSILGVDVNDEVFDRAIEIAARLDALDDRRAAAAQRRVADMISARLPKPLSDADRAAIAAVQARADKVYTAHSKPSRPPYAGESPTAYRLRLLKEWQPYNTKWKNADLAAVDAKTFADAEAEVYADAIAASYAEPADGGLYESIHIDRRTGWRTITFHGRPSDWLNQFAHRRMRARINRYPNATNPTEEK